MVVGDYLFSSFLRFSRLDVGADALNRQSPSRWVGPVLLGGGASERSILDWQTVALPAAGCIGSLMLLNYIELTICWPMAERRPSYGGRDVGRLPRPRHRHLVHSC